MDLRARRESDRSRVPRWRGRSSGFHSGRHHPGNGLTAQRFRHEVPDHRRPPAPAQPPCASQILGEAWPEADVLEVPTLARGLALMQKHRISRPPSCCSTSSCPTRPAASKAPCARMKMVRYPRRSRAGYRAPKAMPHPGRPAAGRWAPRGLSAASDCAAAAELVPALQRLLARRALRHRRRWPRATAGQARARSAAEPLRTCGPAPA